MIRCAGGGPAPPAHFPPDCPLSGGHNEGALTKEAVMEWLAKLIFLTGIATLGWLSVTLASVLLAHLVHGAALLYKWVPQHIPFQRRR